VSQAQPGRVLVFGALGRMGERVRAALAEEPRLQLAVALEAPDHSRLGEVVENGVRITSDAKAALEQCDVAIVFATPKPSLEFLRRAAAAGVPCAIGTTGFSDEERCEIKNLAERIAIVLAPNFSIAVNVLTQLAREAARLLGPAYDAEILELHHSQKRDAPSGTALKLGEAVAEGRGKKLAEHAVFSRHGETGARLAGSIAFQTLRGGDNPGEHTVFLLGKGERLELTHRATSRDPFAQGSVRAALWLLARGPGFYCIEDITI